MDILDKMRKKPKLPRVPIPIKVGSAHKRKNKVLERKRKHKKPEVED